MLSPLLDFKLLGASPGSATDPQWELGLVLQLPCAWKMGIPREAPHRAAER